MTHTIFASHFRRPLPRWADEGGCTTVEHESERYKQQKLLVQFLQTGRGIPFSQMFVMKEYPRDILPLYAQGHSLSSLLIAKGGKRKFLDTSARARYRRLGRDDQEVLRLRVVGQLQETWLAWVRNGSPAVNADPEVLLVSNESSERPRVLRGQSPDSVRGEPNVIAPLVAIQRPNRGAAQVANNVPQGHGNRRVALNRSPTTWLQIKLPPAPGPYAPPVTRRFGVPADFDRSASTVGVRGLNPAQAIRCFAVSPQATRMNAVSFNEFLRCVPSPLVDHCPNRDEWRE